MSRLNKDEVISDAETETDTSEATMGQSNSSPNRTISMEFSSGSELGSDLTSNAGSDARSDSGSNSRSDSGSDEVFNSGSKSKTEPLVEEVNLEEEIEYIQGLDDHFRHSVLKTSSSTPKAKRLNLSDVTERSSSILPAVYPGTSRPQRSPLAKFGRLAAKRPSLELLDSEDSSSNVIVISDSEDMDMPKPAKNRASDPIELQESKEMNRLVSSIGLDLNAAQELEKNRFNEVLRRVQLFTENIELNDSVVELESDFNDRYLHKDDRYNTPNSSGRVLVNIGHSDKEPNVYVADEIAKNRSCKLKAHQIGGIRFLYDNLIGSVTNFDRFGGFGCILSHSMGLGKTVQVIAISEILLRYTTSKTVMILLPINVLENWKQEFDKWLNGYQVFCVNGLSGQRLYKEINRWFSWGGVLLIGYEKYLSTISSAETTQNKGGSREQLRHASNVLAALRDPGPDLVACDEGHRLKSDDTRINKSLKKMRTKRRVIMTGYPLQNRLLEYYCMIDFVRPRYLGPKADFKRTFDQPIKNGQCKDANDFDKKLMKERTQALDHLVKGFIQRRNEDVLAKTIEKTEIVLLCKLKEVQIELMRQLLEKSLQTLNPEDKLSFLRVFIICSKICNHPDMIHDVVEGHNRENKDLYEFQTDQLTYSWAKPVFDRLKSESKYEELVLKNSAKMELLFEILEETVVRGEKLLVFSQWQFTLNLIEKFLKSKFVPNSGQKWRNGLNYYRLDGQVKATDRQEMVKRFNEESSGAKLFLISTRAGGEGINLTAANRIIIFDASWNPCRDAQAACRIFREGQTRKCFVYRLISDRSMEKFVFNLQVYKRAMFMGVVDQQNVELNLAQKEVRTIICNLWKQLPKTDNASDESVEQSSFDGHSEEPIVSDILEKDDLIGNVCKQDRDLLTKDPFPLDSWIKIIKDPALERNQKKNALMELDMTDEQMIEQLSLMSFD